MKLKYSTMAKLLPLTLLAISTCSLSAKQVDISTVNYVYQLDSDPTTFEFNASVTSGCGYNSYRVKSPSEAVAARKFNLVLAAFTTGKNLAFHDTEVCESGRAVVGWVRITN